MRKRVRLVPFAAMAVLSTAVVGVSLSWACSGSDIGIPATGKTAPAADASPPASGGDAALPPASASPAPTAGAVAPATPGVSSALGRSTSGAVTKRKSSTGLVNPGAGENRARSGAGSISPQLATQVRSQFEARVDGATEGVKRSGGQPVFASSAPKGKATRGAHGKTASVRSANADVWSTFASPKRSSSVTAARSFAPGENGGSGLGIGAAILGLGMAGVLGTMLVAGLGRRRVRAERRIK